jgi:hypothetical protein
MHKLDHITASGRSNGGPTGPRFSKKTNVSFGDFKKFVGLAMYFRLDPDLASKFEAMHKETFKVMLMDENLADGKPVCAKSAEDLYTCFWHIYNGVMDERKAKPIMDAWLAQLAESDAAAAAAAAAAKACDGASGPSCPSGGPTGGPSGPTGAFGTGSSGPSGPAACFDSTISLENFKDFLIASRAICDPAQLNQSWNGRDDFDTPAFKNYIKSLENSSWPMVGFEEALDIFEYMRMCWY